MCNEPPTVFIIDDDEAMLDAVATMAQTVSIRTKTYLRAEDFLSDYREEHPGCLVLDVRMPEISGSELQDELNRREIEIPIIVISGHADVQIAVKMVKSGALDFFEKPFKEQVLLDAIQHAFKLDKERRHLQMKCAVCRERYATLTPREKEVMALMVKGKTGKEIASKLGISYKTVEKFRAKVIKKMNAQSIAELVLIAVNLGLINPEDHLDM